MGDRARNIAHALTALDASGVRVLRCSSLYRTAPVDAPPQPWFLNCAVEAQTKLLPRQLLLAVRRIEHALGRRRSMARGPRTIDIDILLYGDSRIRMRDLQIPHPLMHERRFVLVPLAELAPRLRHPQLQKTIADLLTHTADRSQVIRWRGGALRRQ